MSSQGYCFQVGRSLAGLLADSAVREVPITFTERERGSSKMSSAIVAEALWRVTCWGAARVLRRSRAHSGGPVRA